MRLGDERISGYACPSVTPSSGEEISETYPRLGVVLPTYNRAQLLRRAIESVLAQSEPADEIIVVDDGSTDDTGAVARSFGEAVTYLRQDNRGVAAARNVGVSLLTTTFVAFLDDDDVWFP